MDEVNTPTAHGLSELHIAVISGQASRVSKILTHHNKKDLIDVSDADGMTPLMAAVLAGRLTIARLLLQDGASAHVRDRRGYQAVDYSRVSKFKTKIDTYRRLGILELDAEQQGKRAAISKILRYTAALESCRRMGQHECSRALFFKEGAELNVLRPNLTFRIAKENLERATTGVIASAMCPLVKTAAVSGWQDNPGRALDVLSNKKYLRLVQELAAILKFTLTRSPRDNNGRPRPEHSGRFVSSHAEKKLAVFWLIAVLKAVLDTMDLKRVHQLRGMTIPPPWREAWIFLDHTPCENCWQFLHRIKQTTGIGIYVETRPFLTKTNRQDVTGCRHCACARCTRRFGAEQTRDNHQLDPEQCDDGTELKPMSSEKGAAVPRLELNRGPNSQVGASLALQGEDGTRPDALPAWTSRAPRTWRHFVDEETGLTYAKPVYRPIGRHRTLSPEPAAALELREPTSTIAGRSGFFTTPDPGRSVEVQILRMSSRAREEYDRISNISGTLDLGRFAYNPPAPAVPSAPKKAGRQRKPQKPVGSGKNTKVAATSGRSPSKVSKLERTRVRSSFARAVEHHQRRRAGKT